MQGFMNLASYWTLVKRNFMGPVMTFQSVKCQGVCRNGEGKYIGTDSFRIRNGISIGCYSSSNYSKCYNGNDNMSSR